MSCIYGRSKNVILPELFQQRNLICYSIACSSITSSRVEGGKKRTLSKNCSQSLNIGRIAALYDGICTSCSKL